MALRKTGLNPLAYLGVEPITPPQQVQYPRSPTIGDKEFDLGTIWINLLSLQIYMLVQNTNASGAIWSLLSTGNSPVDRLIGNSGYADPNGSGDINVFGATLNITTTGDNVNTLTVTLNNIITIDGALFPNTDIGANVGFIKFGSQPFITNLGVNNTFIGANAGNSLLDVAFSSDNVAVGSYALNSLTNTINNVAIGSLAGTNIEQGENNITIGYNSAVNYTNAESSNIIIGSAGVTGESNVLRIGTDGSGLGEINKAFMAGVYNVTPAGTSPGNVIIDEFGQLGTGGGAGIVQWIVVTVDTQIVNNTGYIANSGSVLVFTMPLTASVGTIIRICGMGTAPWQIELQPGQEVIAPASLSTTTFVTSSDPYDAIEMVCSVADTKFNVLSSMGNLSYA